MILTHRIALSGIALWLALGCRDTGVVGELPACDPACAADEICDAQRARCVACIEDSDCSAAKGGSYCVAARCVECRAVDDCGSEAVACEDGRCAQCAGDAACAGNRQCPDASCDEPEDDEDDDEAEEQDHDHEGSGESGESGNSGPGGEAGSSSSD